MEVRGMMGDGGHRVGASPAPTIHEVVALRICWMYHLE